MVACIAPVDRAEVLKRLDRLDFPHPVRQVLEATSIRHDREEIAALLKDAAQLQRRREIVESAADCFAGAGSCGGALSRTLAGQRVRVRMKAQTDPKIMENTEATLSSWVKKLCDIVMTRQDGRFLGSQWLLLKARR